MATVVPEARHHDAPESDLDRYALYVVNSATFANRVGMTGDLWHESRNRRRVYCTSRDGIGQGLEMLYEEDEVPRGWRIGVLDREKRFWLVNPFA